MSYHDFLWDVIYTAVTIGTVAVIVFVVIAIYESIREWVKGK